MTKKNIDEILQKDSSLKKNNFRQGKFLGENILDHFLKLLSEIFFFKKKLLGTLGAKFEAWMSDRKARKTTSL